MAELRLTDRLTGVLGARTAQGARHRSGPAHGRGPAAPLPPPLRRARPAHRPRAARDRRARHRDGARVDRGPQDLPGPPDRSSRRPARGRGHRRHGRADAHVLQAGLARARADASVAWACSPARSACSTGAASSPTPTTCCSPTTRSTCSTPHRRRCVPTGGQPEDAAEPDDVDTVLRWAGALIPVYPATAAMPSWKIASAMGIVLDQLPDDLDDPIPATPACASRLPDLRGALLGVHRPASRATTSRAARERLRWDEAFVLQTVLAQRRLAAVGPAGRRARAARRRPARGVRGAARRSPSPTARSRSARTIAEDMARTHPMHRLLQGEVGSGKTLVALRAMLTVVDSGGQAVLLAPTEVLAQQHHRSITAMLGPLAERGLLGGSDLGTRVALLTGSASTARRRQAMLDIASGEAGIVIGTHALLEDAGHVLRPRARRGRRAAPLRRRAARRAGGQVARRQPAARAGHDGHADPAHRGDDGLRRPRGLDPHRAAPGPVAASRPTSCPRWRSPTSSSAPGRGSSTRWPQGRQAYVVCPRIGGDERASTDDVDAPDDDDAAPACRRARARSAARRRTSSRAVRVGHPARADAARREGRRDARASPPVPGVRTGSTCSSPRPSSRSGSTCPTPRSWS